MYKEFSLCKPWRPLRPKQFKGAPPSPPHTLQRWTETLVRRLCGSRLSKPLRYLLSRSQYGAPKQQGCRTSSRDRPEPNLRYARSLIGQVSFPTSRCGQQLRSGAARGGSQIPHITRPRRITLQRVRRKMMSNNSDRRVRPSQGPMM